MKAELPINENARIKALHDLAILDTPREQNFDDIAQIAMQLCDVPIAVVSLVDVNRQWFKSCLGLDASETPRDIAFCAHAILTPDDVLVIEDATADERFADNSLVTGEPHIRFYAGAPLITEEGYALGTLCVIDRKPRQLNEGQIVALKGLAKQVIQSLRLKSACDAMHQYSVRMQTISDSAPVLIGELDANNRYVFANKKYQDWHGGHAINMVGKTPRELFSAQISEKIEAAIANSLRGKRTTVEIALAGGDISLSYFANADKNSVYEIGVDITDQKQLEKMKAGFIATVSHELRTPLTSISGALSLVLGNMLDELSEKAKKILGIAYKNSQRLNLLVNDLLDMEKLIAGKMNFQFDEEVLLDLVQQSLVENEAYANKYEISYRLHNEVDSAKINIDSFRFQQVLCNFLSNAAKYSPRNGCVDVELSRVGDCLRVAVRDYGIGISEKFQAQVFHKFSQADISDSRNKGGTGLGLAVSKELVDRMGGRIGFDRELNQGARFYAEFKESNNA